jgi:hypothetical protein
VYDESTEEDNLVGKYDLMTCHQKCQEDKECEMFSIALGNDDAAQNGICKLYNYGACTKSTSEVLNTNLYARSAFREISLTIPDRCTHFQLHNEDAPKVTACKEITSLRDCRLLGNYYNQLGDVDAKCGGVTYDMDYRKKIIDLSAVEGGYTAANC